MHYVVFTRKDNVWNNEFIKTYLAILDKIEASEGPGVMVSIGTGNKLFSTGFDLDFWASSYDNMTNSIDAFQEIMARVLSFSMPTMCVFNGTAIAGGYLFGLCHDFRIMKDSADICLSELKLTLALPPAYMKLC